MYEQLSQIMQGLQLASYGVFESLQILTRLFATLELHCQLIQPRRLLGVVSLQPLIVVNEADVGQLQLLRRAANQTKSLRSR
jgi:hypothetical protein